MHQFMLINLFVAKIYALNYAWSIKGLKPEYLIAIKMLIIDKWKVLNLGKRNLQ